MSSVNKLYLPQKEFEQPNFKHHFPQGKQSIPIFNNEIYVIGGARGSVAYVIGGQRGIVDYDDLI